jgi:hypothetical protein
MFLFLNIFSETTEIAVSFIIVIANVLFFGIIGIMILYHGWSHVVTMAGKVTKRLAGGGNTKASSVVSPSNEGGGTAEDGHTATAAHPMAAEDNTNLPLASAALSSPPLPLPSPLAISPEGSPLGSNNGVELANLASPRALLPISAMISDDQHNDNNDGHLGHDTGLNHLRTPPTPIIVTTATFVTTSPLAAPPSLAAPSPRSGNGITPSAHNRSPSITRHHTPNGETKMVFVSTPQSSRHNMEGLPSFLNAPYGHGLHTEESHELVPVLLSASSSSSSLATVQELPLQQEINDQ